jgi:hypothetical protein
MEAHNQMNVAEEEEEEEEVWIGAPAKLMSSLYFYFFLSF